MNRCASDQRGAALLITLLMVVVLGALAAGVVTITITETMISGAHRTAQETAYAAEAALERAIHDLATIGDWSPVLALPPGNLTSTFFDGQLSPTAPDGRRLDTPTLTVERQRNSDARDGPLVTASDWPRWRVYAQGSLDRLPTRAPGPPAYLIVWVADDREGDGDPGRDTNGQILVLAEAYGTGGARRAVEAVIRRSAPGVVQLLTRRAVR
jgi:hypothetical protein